MMYNALYIMLEKPLSLIWLKGKLRKKNRQKVIKMIFRWQKNILQICILLILILLKSKKGDNTKR